MRESLAAHLPLVAAHRGASRFAPENTMASFQKAVALGARAIELDVRLTADDEVVVVHDHGLRRTTTGQGQVGDRTWSEVRALDAGSRFDSAFADERVPRLDDVLSWAKDRVWLNIELKPATGDDGRLARRVVDVVRDLSMTDGCLVMSFDHVAVEAAKAMAPEILGLVIAGARLAREIAYLQSIGADGSNHSPLWWTAESCEAFRVAGLLSHASLVNDAAVWRQALLNGLDMVDSDEPAIYGAGAL